MLLSLRGAGDALAAGADQPTAFLARQAAAVPHSGSPPPLRTAMIRQDIAIGGDVSRHTCRLGGIGGM
jgi:hypothetical protein